MKSFAFHSIVKHAYGSPASGGEMVYWRVSASGPLMDATVQEELKRFRSQADTWCIQPTWKAKGVRVSKGAKLGCPGEKIALFDLRPSRSLDFHRRALSRLGAAATASSNTYDFFYSIVTEETGTWCYNWTSREIEWYDDDDRLTMLKHKRRGRKSAVSRTLNRMQRIKDHYASTLFPEGWKSDPTFLRLEKYLPDQERRVAEANLMRMRDIPEFSTSSIPEYAMDEIRHLAKSDKRV